MKLTLYLLLFVYEVTSGDNNCPNVGSVTREKWGAHSPKEAYDELPKAIPYVFIQHTAGESCPDFKQCSERVKWIQGYHMYDKGWNDIAYNFLIGGDGRVYIGRGWGNIGAHTYGYNSRSYGIAFIGTFNDQLPTNEAITAAQKLIFCGVQNGYIKKSYGLYGHKDTSCTVSPGYLLYEELKSWGNWHALGDIHRFCSDN